MVIVPFKKKWNIIYSDHIIDKRNIYLIINAPISLIMSRHINDLLDYFCAANIMTLKLANLNGKMITHVNWSFEEKNESRINQCATFSLKSTEILWPMLSRNLSCFKSLTAKKVDSIESKTTLKLQYLIN